MFPRNSQQPPGLLSSLQRLLYERLRDATVEATAQPLDHRPRGIARNLNLAVHSAVFEQFVRAFTSYSGLLREIKDELDGALDDAVRCARENIDLRAQLVKADAERTRAVEGAYMTAASTAAQFRYATLLRSIQTSSYPYGGLYVPL